MSPPVAKFLAASSAVAAALGGSWLSRCCCCCYLMLPNWRCQCVRCPLPSTLCSISLSPSAAIAAAPTQSWPKQRWSVPLCPLSFAYSSSSFACCLKPVCARLPSSLPPLSMCVCVSVCVFVCVPLYACILNSIECILYTRCSLACPLAGPCSSLLLFFQATSTLRIRNVAQQRAHSLEIGGVINVFKL